MLLLWIRFVLVCLVCATAWKALLHYMHGYCRSKNKQFMKLDILPVNFLSSLIIKIDKNIKLFLCERNTKYCHKD